MINSSAFNLSSAMVDIYDYASPPEFIHVYSLNENLIYLKI